MSELKEEGSEQARFRELERRYQALYDWAKDQEFVMVYRTEGDPSWLVDRSGNTELRGSWYTDRFEMIAGLKRNIEEMRGMSAKVYSLVIPKALLEERDSMTKGMNEVNIVNEDLRAGRKEIAELVQRDSEPSLEEYLQQFAFVREYLAQKQQ